MLLSVLIVCGSLGDKNLKMAAPLEAKLAPESSYYLVVIYVELPFHSLCKQFIIITVVFIGLLVQKAKFLLKHGNQYQNPSNLLQKPRKSLGRHWYHAII